MLSAAEGILLSIATVEAGLGVLGNTFIALVKCMDWAKNKKLSKIGFLLFGLATSRIFIIWILILDAYTKLFFPGKYSSKSLTEIIFCIWMTVNHSLVCHQPQHLLFPKNSKFFPLYISLVEEENG